MKSKTYQNMKTFAGGAGYIMPNLKLARDIGIRETFFLGYLIFKLDQFEDLNPGDIVDGFFPLKEEMVTKELGLSKKQQRPLKKRLMDLGFIEYKAGPSKNRNNQNWFLVNMDSVKAFNLDAGTSSKDSRHSDQTVTAMVTKRAPLKLPNGHLPYNNKTSNKTIHNSSFSKEPKKGADAPLGVSHSKREGDPATEIKTSYNERESKHDPATEYEGRFDLLKEIDKLVSGDTTPA